MPGTSSTFYEKENNEDLSSENEDIISSIGGDEVRENLAVGDLKREPMADKVKLVLGYLTAVKGDLKERQGLAISGAISMAVEEVR